MATTMQNVELPALVELEAFDAVVLEGGFTAGARRIGATKQVTSERVARLEKRLGVRLLHRTTRRVRPTDEGLAFHARATQALGLLRQSMGDLRKTASRPEGRLRVSAPVLFGHAFLSPLVNDYLAKYPQVQVELTLADRAVDVVEEGYDLALRVGSPVDSSLASRRLGPAYSYLVGAPGLFARRGRPVSAADVARLPAVLFREDETWTIGGVRVKPVPRLLVNSLELACDAALRGTGVAVVPSILVAAHIDKGRLVSPFVEPIRTGVVSALFASRTFLAPKVRVFLDLVASRLERMEPLKPRRKR